MKRRILGTLAVALIGGIGFAAQADEEDAVDSFRRLIFMANLDPVPWEQVPPELESIGTFLQNESGEIGDRFVSRADSLMERLYHESTISVRTPMMQMQTG